MVKWIGVFKFGRKPDLEIFFQWLNLGTEKRFFFF